MSRIPLTRLFALPAALALVLGALLLAEPVRAADNDLAVADRVMRAIDLLGTPYRKRGDSPKTGFDCSGFMGYLFRVGDRVDLPRTAREMFELASSRAEKVAREAIAPGDLLFFRIGRLGMRVDHVGLYIGDDRFVHAPASGGEVRIDTLDLPYWKKHYAGARRVISSGRETAAPDIEVAVQPVDSATEPLASLSTNNPEDAP